jgi:hypothetical protein
MEANRNRREMKWILPISALIFSFILLQTLASFRVLCLPAPYARLVPFARVCDPLLWPFLSYPMYDNPHYLGERINRPRMFGVLEDQSEVSISQRELGIRITQFVNIHQAILETGDETQVQAIVDLYEGRTNQRLIALHLEYDPVEFTENGFVQVDRERLLTIWLDPQGEVQ